MKELDKKYCLLREGIKVLVVDDEPVSRLMVTQQLLSQGFIVNSTDNGNEALELIRNQANDIDLVLLDVIMPDKTGYEVCQEIRQMYTPIELPVIMLTAQDEVSAIVKGFDSGANDYLTKPITNSELIARFNAHVQATRLNKILQENNSRLIHEINEKKQAEERLSEANKSLSELNTTKDKFFSIIGHDLRSSFSSLLTCSDLLSKSANKYSMEKIQDLARKLNKSAQNTLQLLDNLLYWARIQRGKMFYDPKKIELIKISLKSIVLFTEIAEQKNIKLNHNIKRGVFVYADSKMADLIFRNLISNAVKFTQNGDIHISSREIDGFVEITICDTGTGISEENMKKLFTLGIFSQHGTAGEKGTGLGLVLCKELIEKNNGKINIESQPGKGTKVCFSIPANE